MSKKNNLLQNSIRTIQPHQPIKLPKTNSLVPPSMSVGITQGEYTRVNSTLGKSTQVDSPCSTSEENSAKQVESTSVKNTLVEFTHVEFTADETQALENADAVVKSRNKLKRVKKIKQAAAMNPGLTADVQETLMQRYLSGGWGRMSHSLATLLKAPKRAGLTPTDASIVFAIYDRTYALVEAKPLAPITAGELSSDTLIDPSNLWRSLKKLEDMGVLLKMKASAQVVFWGINPDFLDRIKRGESTSVKSTPVNSTLGTSPSSKAVENTRNEACKNNTSETASSNGNYSENSVSKNLLKESKKESSSSYESSFPKDLLGRWTTMKKERKFGLAEKEQRQFQQLHAEFGSVVFEHCGAVIQYLEKVGNGKTGEEGKIHFPFSYLAEYWPIQFDRFQRYLREELTKAEAKARSETVYQAQLAQNEAVRKSLDHRSAQTGIDLDAVKQSFCAIYQNESDQNQAARDLLRSRGKDTYLLLMSNSKQGWQFPAVKAEILAIFHENQVMSIRTQIAHAVGAA